MHAWDIIIPGRPVQWDLFMGIHGQKNIFMYSIYIYIHVDLQWDMMGSQYYNFNIRNEMGQCIYKEFS